jgi:hypothetical protein
MSDRESTKALMQLLERHYIKPGALPGGVFVPECGHNGSQSSRRCDALFVGFTSTSGRLLIGHEVKVSRADWRKELDNAGKADVWADNCHAWYVVAPSTAIVPPDELPAGWGLMIPSPRSKTRMQIVVKAQVDHLRIPDWMTTRSIMARLDTLKWTELADMRDRIRAEESERAQNLAEITNDSKRPMTEDERRRLRLLEALEAHLETRVDNHWAFADEVEDTTWANPHDFAAALTIVRTLRTLPRSQGYQVEKLREAGTKAVAAAQAIAAALDSVHVVHDGLRTAPEATS